MARTVNKDMLMGQLVRMDPVIIEVLMREPTHCIGCPSSQMESLEQACMVHGLDVNEVVEDINMVLEQCE